MVLYQNCHLLKLFRVYMRNCYGYTVCNVQSIKRVMLLFKYFLVKSYSRHWVRGTSTVV